MIEIREIVKQNPLLAIMRNVPLEITEEYAQAVREGGVNFFEVAMNSAHALEQIRRLRKRFGEDILLGAGTILSPEMADQACEAGARFLLTPSTDSRVLAHCQEKKIPLMPGALTPSEAALCLSYGFPTIKLFPAGDMPMGYIKSLKGPLDQTEYVAIGGVNEKNLEEFFRRGYLGVGLGSGLMPKEAVKNRDWKACSAYVKQMVERIQKVQQETGTEK